MCNYDKMSAICCDRLDSILSPNSVTEFSTPDVTVDSEDKIDKEKNSL